MRGRTNASNGGIFLNATTDDFEVATGNTIVAGDFVEYHYDTAEKTISGSSFSEECFLVDATAKLYITRLSGYATLITYDNGTITIEDSYTTAQSTELVKYNDTTYLSTSGDVFTVDVANKTLSLSSNINKTFQHKVGNYLVSVERSGSSTVTYTVKTFSCADLSNITLVDTKSVTDQSGSQLVIGKSFGNGICFGVYLVSNTSSQHMAYGKLKFAYIDLTNGSITSIENLLVFDTSASSSISASMTFVGNAIGERYILTHFHYGYSGHYTYEDRIYDTTSRDLKNNLSTADNYIPVRSDYTDKNGYYYWLLYYATSGSTFFFDLYKTDKQTGLSELCDTVSATYNTSPLWVFDNNDFALLRVSSPSIYYKIARAISDEIVEGALTDTVQEWSGGINPLGVAKQSGTAGDTIAVYIPQVNS